MGPRTLPVVSLPKKLLAEERRMALVECGDFRVYVVNRKQGLQPGESMSDIAGHPATGIEDELGGPAFLTETSTGGSVALQLAVDRPDLVRALVMIASAYRLGPTGRQIQQDLASLTRSGIRRQVGRRWGPRCCRRSCRAQCSPLLEC